MAGKTVGELQIDLQMNGKSLNASMKNVEKNVQSNGTNSGGKFANAFTVAAGNILAKGIGTAIDIVGSHVDDAIKRIDTIRNFPNVMSNMGISADKSEKAITKLKDALQGVPTNLDDAAAAVQRLTSKNGDVEKSSDLFLALNDAMLAGGMSAEIQSTAMEQISQAYSKGKPDMVEWKSLLTAMPAQAKQIAIAMGYGADGVAALGEDLRKGAVSMDDFMDTIIRLDTEGVEGFTSFRDQMESTTGGIQRAINVMNSRITQGVAQMIEDIGPENIADMLLSVGNALKDVFKWVAGVINFVRENQWIQPFALGLLGAVATAIVALQLGLGGVPALIAGLVAGIILLLMNIEKFGAFMQDLGAKFGAWLRETVLPAIGQFFASVWGKIVEFFGGIGQWFRDRFTDAVNAIKSVFGTVVGWLRGIFNGIVNVFRAVGTTIGNAVGGAFKAVVNGIIGFAERFVNAPINAINALIDVINAVPGISLGKLSTLKLPRMAQGGLVTGSTIANIGEDGREAVLPLDRNTDNWSGLLASALADEFDARGGGGGGGITIEKQIFDISNEMDADDIGRKVMNSLRRAA